MLTNFSTFLYRSKSRDPHVDLPSSRSRHESSQQQWRPYPRWSPGTRLYVFVHQSQTTDSRLTALSPFVMVMRNIVRKRFVHPTLLHAHPRDTDTRAVQGDQSLQVQETVYHFHICAVPTQLYHVQQRGHEKCGDKHE